MKGLYLELIIVFVIVYSFFVLFIDINTDLASEIVVASVFFFALFSGFFITRQNERYTRVTQEIADSDGAFSYLYRISGLVPRIQKIVREIIRDHYQKIAETNNWAYHILHPSMTLTRLTQAFGSLNSGLG